MEVNEPKEYKRKELKDYDLNEKELEQEHREHKIREHKQKVQDYLDKHSIVCPLKPLFF